VPEQLDYFTRPTSSSSSNLPHQTGRFLVTGVILSNAITKHLFLLNAHRRMTMCLGFASQSALTTHFNTAVCRKGSTTHTHAKEHISQSGRRCIVEQVL
jgi:hypothetical protein